jgi:inhibitor of KinA
MFWKAMNKYKIFPLGNALTISFGNLISPKINDLVLNLANFIEKISFRGFIECVPAYSSLTIFYDVIKVRKEFSGYKTAFDAVENLIEKAVLNLENSTEKISNLIEVPVNFNKEFALDLESVADKNKLTTEEVIEIFTSKIYRVYMLGFLPGFAYMGELDERIATPRKKTPRNLVPKGSVGIAGTQTGIYPLESPGGWQIIGKTNVELFTPIGVDLTIFQPGDSVKFFKI